MKNCECCGMVVSKHRSIRANLIYYAFRVYICTRCLNKSDFSYKITQHNKKVSKEGFIRNQFSIKANF